MNEVITKLNEIEEKAQGMIDEARAGKDAMQSQLAFDKRELDERYEQEAKAWEEVIRQRLIGESKADAERRKAEGEQALEELEQQFIRTKEARVEELFQKVIQ